MLSSLASNLAFVVTLLLLAYEVSAQSSVDPLNGSSFVTPVFSASQTFTPITTFAQASGGSPTVIGGAGPSPATGSYQFTYTVPTATVSPLPATAVYASLASSNNYNTATDAKGLAPDPSHLQIADSAMNVNYAALKAAFLTVAAAAIAVVVL